MTEQWLPRVLREMKTVTGIHVGEYGSHYGEVWDTDYHGYGLGLDADHGLFVAKLAHGTVLQDFASVSSFSFALYPTVTEMTHAILSWIDPAFAHAYAARKRFVDETVEAWLTMVRQEGDTCLFWEYRGESYLLGKQAVKGIQTFSLSTEERDVFILRYRGDVWTTLLMTDMLHRLEFFREEGEVWW